MSDWKEFSIGEIADPADRYSFSGGPFGSNLKSEEYTEGGVRIIQLQNIGDGHFKDNYKIYTSKEKADELLSCNIYPGEIILSKMGDPVARATLIPDSEERYLMASDGIRLKVDTARFDSVFILNAINSPQFRSSAEAVSVGSTRKRIGLTTLKGLTIYAPPLPEQKKIAKILSRIDKAIYNLKSCLGKQEILKKSLIGELISYADANLGISSKANYYCLGDISTRITDGTHQAVKTSNHGTIPFLYVSCVKDGIIDWSKSALISEEQYAVATQGRQPYPGDILYTAVGSYGNAVMVATNHRFCFQRHIALIQLDKEMAVPKFIELALSSDQTKKSVDQVVAGNAQPTLTLGELRKLQIPLPPLDIQRRICEIISPVEQKVASLENKINAMHHLKQSVSSDLLSGRKRVSV